MAGLWPCAPCHDLNTIFTLCTIKYQGVKTGVLQSPPPYNSIALSALQFLQKNATVEPPLVLYKIKQKRTC